MGTPTNATAGTTTVHTLTITGQTPTVTFTTAAQSVNEGSVATITAQLSSASSQTVTVPFTVGGTATNAADYTITASPLTIAAGSTTATITVTAVVNAPLEPDETVIVTLGTPTNATLGATTVHTVTIAAQLPTVFFDIANQGVSEGVGTATILVRLGGGSSSQTVTVPFTVTGTATNPADYTISASPVTIPAGSTSATITVTVVADAVAEPNETVIVTMGTPINAVFFPGSPTVHTLTILGQTPTVTFTAASQSVSEAVGTATITAQLSSTSTQAVTVPFTVTGTAANPADYTITASPVTIAAGSTTATITVTVVADAVAEPDETVIVTMGTPTNATAGATTVHTLTITGGGGGGNVSVTFCAADAPIWVAAQDGNGAWTRVLPTSGTTYQFSFGSGKGGVAVVDTIGTGTSLNVTYATVADFTGLAATANFGGCGAKTVNGTVANVALTETAVASLGFSFAFVIPAISSSFQLLNVADGPQDLIGVRSDATFVANKVIIRRALNPANNSTLAVLDFDAEGFVPASANVTVTGLGLDTAGVSSVFVGAGGSAFGAIGSIPQYVAASGAQPYAAIPLAQLNANEFQQLSAFALAAGDPNRDRSAGVYFRSPVNQAIALGPALNTPTVTKVVTAPNARPRVQLLSQAQYNRFFSASFTQSSLNKDVSLDATAAYFGGTPGTWDVTMPDLSAAAGWNSAWGLQDGTPIDWTVAAEGGASPSFDGTITDGSTSQSASVSSATPLTVRALRAGADPFTAQRRLLDVLRDQLRSPLH
jgi:hypothetical protein